MISVPVPMMVMIFGEACRATQPRKDACRAPDGPDGLALDSVWAPRRTENGCVDHTEVMIYSEGQALLLALVDYCHKDTCHCAFCQGRPS